MVAVTYGVARVPPPKTLSARKPLRRAKAFRPLHGCADGSAPAAGAIAKSSRHAHLAAEHVDERGNRLINTVDKMPFSG